MGIYKDCDIRGVYGGELFDADAYYIGRAIGGMAGARVCVGGDVRLSTPALKQQLIDGLRASGAHVIDLGFIPTPAMYYTLKRRAAAGGVMVTASHNPPGHNGFKININGAAGRELIDEIKRRVLSRDYPDGVGGYETENILPEYIKSFADNFTGGGLRVAVDAGNGAMGETAPAALRTRGYDVAELFCNHDGRFPNRSPNPAEYGVLTALGGAVKNSGADLGVAFDGDGDRVVFVDDNGETVGSERALVLFIRHILKNNPAPVVYDLKSSSVVRDAILGMSGQPLIERSGHTFIKNTFLRQNAALAGEVSGHFFFRALGYDDGLYAAFTMLDIIASANAPLSALLKDIKILPITPDLRVECPYEEQDGWLDKIRFIGKNFKTDELDGVRVVFPYGWLLVRKSVTAAQMTFRAEADTDDNLCKILKMIIDAVPETENVLTGWR